MKILFIRGFDTDLNNKNSPDKYKNFEKNIKHDIVFFNYGTNEHIKNVFEKLCSHINTYTYNLILAHSMGGCLFTKYLQLNPFFYEKTKTKIILIAPFLVPQQLHKKYLKWNFMKYLTLPTYFVYNSVKFNCSWVNLKQIHQIYKKKYGFFLEEPILIKTLNEYPLLFIIYSKEEDSTTIPLSILEKFNQVVYVDGGHDTAFQHNDYTDAFFDTLLKIMDEKET